MPVLLVISYTVHASWTRPHPLASGDALALFIHSFLGLGTVCFDTVRQQKPARSVNDPLGFHASTVLISSTSGIKKCT